MPYVTGLEQMLMEKGIEKVCNKQFSRHFATARRRTKSEKFVDNCKSVERGSFQPQFHFAIFPPDISLNHNGRSDFQTKRQGSQTMSGVLPDWVIERDIKIEPFAPAQSRPGMISYGVTSYGYDVRVDRHFKVFTNAHCSIVDPKNFDPKSFVDIHADYCLIPPNSFALAETVEHLEIPRDVIAVCVGKSTYARCGIIVNVTPLEPEWRGRVTIEISNTTPLPAKIYSGEGIAQILFFRAQEFCKVSYADKKGKYQDQTGLTLPFVQPSS